MVKVRDFNHKFAYARDHFYKFFKSMKASQKCIRFTVRQGYFNNDETYVRRFLP